MNAHDQAAVLTVTCLDVPVVQLNGTLGDSESQASATVPVLFCRLPRAKKRIEQPRVVFGRYAAARVANDQPNDGLVRRDDPFDHGAHAVRRLGDDQRGLPR